MSPITDPETQFQDDCDWFVCHLTEQSQSAKENLVRIVKAEAWMRVNCEAESAFRFGGTFYFKNSQDHMLFTLKWKND